MTFGSLLRLLVPLTLCLCATVRLQGQSASPEAIMFLDLRAVRAASGSLPVVELVATRSVPGRMKVAPPMEVHSEDWSVILVDKDGRILEACGHSDPLDGAREVADDHGELRWSPMHVDSATFFVRFSGHPSAHSVRVERVRAGLTERLLETPLVR